MPPVVIGPKKCLFTVLRLTAREGTLGLPAVRRDAGVTREDLWHRGSNPQAMIGTEFFSIGAHTSSTSGSSPPRVSASRLGTQEIRRGTGHLTAVCTGTVGAGDLIARFATQVGCTKYRAKGAGIAYVLLHHWLTLASDLAQWPASIGLGYTAPNQDVQDAAEIDPWQ